LEDRLAPAGGITALAVYESLPQDQGVVHVELLESLVVLSRDDGSTISQFIWPSGSPFDLVGSDADDSVVIDFGPPSNNVNQPQFLLDAGAGQNSLVIQGTTADDTAWAEGTVGGMSAGGFTVSYQNVQNVLLQGGGGRDTVQFTDTPGNDTFTVGPGGATMVDSQGDESQAQGFEVVKAFSVNGGTDSATFYDTPNWDRFEFTPQRIIMHSLNWSYDTVDQAGPFYSAQGFTNVNIVANGGGHNVLWAQGSPWDDTLTFANGQGVLSSAGHYTLNFAGLQMMRFTMNQTAQHGNDVAFVSDGPGNDTFYARGAKGTYLDDGNSYELFVQGFAVVNLDGSGGGINILSQASISYQLNATNFSRGAPYYTAAPLGQAAAMAKIHAVALQLDPSLGQITDPLTLAIALRDFVYHRFWLGYNNNTWLSLDPYNRFMEAIVVRIEGLMCTGVRIVYADLCNAFGLQARYVDMLAPSGQGHSSSEVWINGQWIAMDATFDVSFISPDGEYLNYAQLRAGRAYLVDHNGTQSRSRPKFEEFAVPLSQLLTIVVYPGSGQQIVGSSPSGRRLIFA
jgi:hypothetical protein